MDKTRTFSKRFVRSGVWERMIVVLVRSGVFASKIASPLPRQVWELAEREAFASKHVLNQKRQTLHALPRLSASAVIVIFVVGLAYIAVVTAMARPYED